jgi:hypothetical protein
MNEVLWLNCIDPLRMLEFLRDRGNVSDRKLRMFAVACCRRIWDLLTVQGHGAVEMAERYADCLATNEEKEILANGATTVEEVTAGHRFKAERAVTATLAYDAAQFSAQVGASTKAVQSYFSAEAAGTANRATAAEFIDRASDGERVSQCELLRDIVGNPFHTLPAHDSVLLAQNENLILNLLRSAYDCRILPVGTLDPVRLGILADALEDADAYGEIVAHLRLPGPHVRGCWAIDLFSGRR